MYQIDPGALKSLPSAGPAIVEIGTASYRDLCATEKIVDELAEWCTEHRIGRIAELTGGMQLE